jgi:hypothetical protein
MGLVVAFCWLKSGDTYGVLLPECRPVVEGLSLAPPLTLLAAYKIYDMGFQHSSIWMLLGAAAVFGGYLGRLWGGAASFLAALLAGLLAALPWIGLQMSLGQLDSTLGDGTRVQVQDLLVLSNARKELDVTLNLATAQYTVENQGVKPHHLDSLRWLLRDGSECKSLDSPGVIRPLGHYTGKILVVSRGSKAAPISPQCMLIGTDERIPKLWTVTEVRFKH